MAEEVLDARLLPGSVILDADGSTDPDTTIPASLPARRQLRDSARRTMRRRTTAKVTLVGAVAAIVLPTMIMSGAAQAAGVNAGNMSLAAGKGATADSAAKITDGYASATFVLPGRPVKGSVYLGVEMRRTDKSAYRAKVRVFPNGTIRVGLSKVTNNKEKALGSVPIAATVGTGKTSLNLEGYVSGTAKAQLAVRAWLAGTTMPAWQYAATDSSQVIASGRVRAYAYLSSQATAQYKLSFHSLASVPLGGTPVTSPTTSPTGVTTTPTTSPTGTPPPTSTTVPPTTTTSTTTSTSKAPVTSTTQPVATTTKPTTTTTTAAGAPNASTTGVPAGTKLTVQNGNLTVTKAGTVINAIDLHGFLIIKAANVKVTNSIIRGGVGTTSWGLVTDNEASGTNFQISDSELVPQYPSVYLDGIMGGNFTATRLNIHNTVDGVKIHGSNILVQDSYVHDLHTYAADPYQNNTESHNDGVQILSGSNITIKGSSFTGGTNSAMQVTQDVGPVSGLSYINNWAGNGDCTINLNPKTRSSMGPFTFTGNHFYPTSVRSGCAIVKTTSTSVNASGNTWVGSNAPVVIRLSN